MLWPRFASAPARLSWVRSEPRSSGRAAMGHRSPSSSTPRPRRSEPRSSAGIEERAARAAPKIQLVVAMVLVPSALLAIAAALVAHSDALFSAF